MQEKQKTQHTHSHTHTHHQQQLMPEMRHDTSMHGKKGRKRCPKRGKGKVRETIMIKDGYLLCNALNRDTSPPSSLPTALICLPMAWQSSFPAAICAFSPSRPPRVARSMKETQRREYTASTCVCVARGCDTRSSTWDRKVAKLRSSHWPPSVVTNTT